MERVCTAFDEGCGVVAVERGEQEEAVVVAATAVETAYTVCDRWPTASDFGCEGALVIDVGVDGSRLEEEVVVMVEEEERGEEEGASSSASVGTWMVLMTTGLVALAEDDRGGPGWTPTSIITLDDDVTENVVLPNTVTPPPLPPTEDIATALSMLLLPPLLLATPATSTTLSDTTVTPKSADELITKTLLLPLEVAVAEVAVVVVVVEPELESEASVFFTGGLAASMHTSMLDALSPRGLGSPEGEQLATTALVMAANFDSMAVSILSPCGLPAGEWALGIVPEQLVPVLTLTTAGLLGDSGEGHFDTLGFGGLSLMGCCGCCCFCCCCCCCCCGCCCCFCCCCSCCCTSSVMGDFVWLFLSLFLMVVLVVIGRGDAKNAGCCSWTEPDGLVKQESLASREGDLFELLFDGETAFSSAWRGLLMLQLGVTSSGILRDARNLLCFVFGAFLPPPLLLLLLLPVGGEAMDGGLSADVSPAPGDCGSAGCS